MILYGAGTPFVALPEFDKMQNPFGKAEHIFVFI